MMIRTCLGVGALQFLLFTFLSANPSNALSLSRSSDEFRYASDPQGTFPNPNLIPNFRPPAVPLIVMSPVISIWSMADKLTDDYSRHWALGVNDFRGLISIDGSVYSWWGPSSLCDAGMSGDPGCNAPPLNQTGVSVQPTQTFYTFASDTIQFRVAFTTPAFPNDLTSLAKPWTYISFTVTPLDGQAHVIQVQLDHTAEVAVENKNSYVAWSDVSAGFSNLTNVHAIEMGKYVQIPFDRSGDKERNDWGWSYYFTQSSRASHTVSWSSAARQAFVLGQELPAWDIYGPRKCSEQWPAAVLKWNLGSVTAATSEFAVFAYDDSFSMNYFNDWQRPYWYELYHQDKYAMLQDSLTSYHQIVGKADAYDTTLLAQLSSASSKLAYPTLASLAFRQVTGATTMVWNEKTKEPWMYMKEQSSDGDISTVDVIYPASPFFLQLGPEALRRAIIPLLVYATNGTSMPYRSAFAPHHLGIWPIAQTDTHDQEKMPMEESANILLLCAGIAQKQNNNVDWLAPYWDILAQWSGYLTANLPDPTSQLCTDDFMGPSPHNVNLAIKGTIGLAAYSLLLQYNGNATEAAAVLAQAEGFATQIVYNASTRTKDHLRMQFNLPNSWSQKYNLVWQYFLGVNLYDDSIANNELTYYLAQANKFGFTLDIRNKNTKGDWSSWSATMGRDITQGDLVFDYMFHMANKTPNRVAFTDYWVTTTAGTVPGDLFMARPVMGGLYARLLDFNNTQERLHGHLPGTVKMQAHPLIEQ